MGYKLSWYQKLIMGIFHDKHIVRMKKVLHECKNNEELFTRLPNPDNTVDLHLNQKMFNKAVEPFCGKDIEENVVFIIGASVNGKRE